MDIPFFVVSFFFFFRFVRENLKKITQIIHHLSAAFLGIIGLRNHYIGYSFEGQVFCSITVSFLTEL